jgi:GntR family transcriptional regulator / MocR family aminotransferase
VSTFPRAAWLAAARRSMQATPSEAFGYGDPRGRPELREALAGYLSRARGVRADPERIVICAGYAQGLGLLARVLSNRGAATVAMEAYGHQYHRDIVAAYGLGVRSIPLDQHGATIDPLGDASAAVLTPAHQFPLGMALSAARRTQIVKWAGASGAVVIEDDYDGEFRYDRAAIGAMQALAPNSVVYAGTASKTLAPGLRLGWLVLPPDLLDDVVSAKLLADRQGSVIDQLTMAEFITAGGYDRHVRHCRLLYRRRRDRLVALLHQHAPDVRISGVSAGLHAVVELPPGRCENDVIETASEHGLAVQGLSGFTVDAGSTGPGPALVIGYGTPPAHAVTTAFARLVATLRVGWQTMTETV